MTFFRFPSESNPCAILFLFFHFRRRSTPRTRTPSDGDLRWWEVAVVVPRIPTWASTPTRRIWASAATTATRPGVYGAIPGICPRQCTARSRTTSDLSPSYWYRLPSSWCWPCSVWQRWRSTLAHSRRTSAIVSIHCYISWLVRGIFFWFSFWCFLSIFSFFFGKGGNWYCYGNAAFVRSPNSGPDIICQASHFGWTQVSKLRRNERSVVQFYILLFFSPSWCHQSRAGGGGCGPWKSH